MLHDLRGYEFERKALRANNLRPKEKQLNVVFATVDTAEQEVGRAECIEAKADDYANGAVGREVQIPSPKNPPLICPYKQSLFWGHIRGGVLLSPESGCAGSIQPIYSEGEIPVTFLKVVLKYASDE